MAHKLLLADDSVTIQRVIELTFADEDVQVAVVGDGKQAIDRIQAERPDIVLADTGMPGRDGYDVAEFVKTNPDLAHIPVVLLTGAFEPIDESRARSVGCDAVLVKPFEPQLVINRVKELLSGAWPIRAAESRPTAAAPAEPARVEPLKVEPLKVEPLEVEAPKAETVRVEPVSLQELAVKPAKASEPPSAPDAGGGDSLEDYFDRLDAAFANLATRQPAAASQSDPVAEIADIPAAPAPLHDPTDPVTTWDPDVRGDMSPRQPPPLARTFAALLAAEQGEPMPQGDAQFDTAQTIGAGQISDDVIEDIVRRVLARMGDDTMRRLVLETAERVVREEIDRIKRS